MIIKRVTHVEPGYVEIDGFGRIPFTDAKLPQALEILERDVKHSKCGDPRACVVACSAKRRFGKHLVEVVIYKTMAHVIFRKPDGTFESVRFAIRGNLRKAVNYFDKNRLPDGSGVWLLKPGIYWLSVPSPSEISGARGWRGNETATGMRGNGKGGKQQKGVSVMQAHVRRLLGRNRNAAFPAMANVSA